MTSQRRAFLGWDGVALPRVAAWLVREMGPDLSDLVVALPGTRAARRLEQHLARVLPRGAVPPRLVGFGHLPDELLLTERPVAPRLLRTLLWRDALQGLARERRAALLRRAPADSDSGAWLALAEDVRALHGELARDGKDFAAVAPVARRLAGDEEGRRWEVLADVRDAFLQRLQRFGFEDPHEGRRAALAAGRIDTSRRVALIGVAELNSLVRGLLERLGERATILVLAPESEASGFDELGAVKPEAWCTREIELPRETWRLADRPGDQAECAAAWIAERAPGKRRDEFVVGVPDAEVVPHLQRRLEEVGAAARDARGTPLPATSPGRLLEALVVHLESPGFASFAALLRHPDVPDALRRAGAALPEDVLHQLDEYQKEHLPDALPSPWPGDPGKPAPRTTVAAHDALARLLREFTGAARPAREWAAPLAALLRAIWGQLELRDDVPSERLLAGALAGLGDALRELAAVPPEAGARLPAVEALRLLLRAVSGGRVPPAADPEAIDLLGWLELPLDDAPALVVTGVNEGGVPEPMRRFALLPDGLRRAVGLPDDDQRLARDAYALTLLVRSGRELLLVSGRRSASGDPVRPSRLLFLAPEEVALERAALFGSEAEAKPLEATSVAPPLRELKLLPFAPVASVSVTGFKLYLQSPYRFYLERVARLRRARDDARELDPLLFGSIAHEALEALSGQQGAVPRGHEALAALLGQRVDALVAERCGARPPTAVALQAENLKYRLAAFAAWHAAQIDAGWTVAHTEWEPEGGGVPFEVEGGTLRLTGRIDRIDVHRETGAWRLIDYKTSEKGEGPDKTHRRGEAWIDLQLPLYAQLVQPLLPKLRELGARDEKLELGYVVLPKVAPPVHAFWEPAGWNRAVLDGALAEARRVGGCILRGEFAELKDFGDDDELLAAIAGLGLVGAAEEEDDDEEEGGE